MAQLAPPLLLLPSEVAVESAVPLLAPPLLLLLPSEVAVEAAVPLLAPEPVALRAH